MKIYKFIGFIALLGWSAVSCNDWLDVRPDTEQKEEDQFSTYKGFRDALTGCYMALANEDVYGCRLTMSCTEALAGLWHMPDEPSSTSDRYQDYHLNTPMTEHGRLSRLFIPSFIISLFRPIWLSNMQKIMQPLSPTKQPVR